MKKILIISYYFPPYSGGGIIRVHNFVKYLPENVFSPIILTVDDKYYERTFRNEELIDEYKDEVEIVRTKSFETPSRGLKEKVYGLREKSLKDNLLIFFLKHTINNLLIPDRTILWFPFALQKGLQLIRSQNVKLIFSTAPPFSSHLIAYCLAKMANLPLVLDYRDDWVENVFYDSQCRLRRRIESFLEEKIVKFAKRIISASEESINSFKKKYPYIEKECFIHISNGFDPDIFDEDKYMNSKKRDEKIRFVHTGSLTIRRDPRWFLHAIKELLQDNPELHKKIVIQFIGFSPKKHIDFTRSVGLNDIVKFKNNLSLKAIAKILFEKADICLLFQRNSEGGQTAIPGKLYEYLACNKPILCMTDGGATVNTLKKLGYTSIASYEDINDIKRQILKEILKINSGVTRCGLSKNELNVFNRKEQTKRLSELFKVLL